MWNRLFKSKSSKTNSNKKSSKLSNIIKNLSTHNDVAASIYPDKVVSDSDELIDADNQDIELEPCAICMRTFIPDALEKHVAICEKMRHQRRTPFDSFRQRRGGTNLESYSPSNYGLIAKPKASKSPYLEHKASSKSTICTDAPIKLSIQQRVSPPKSDGIKAGSKETPLLNRSIKRTTGTINEVCPQCGRSFGSRAYDRHVEWCREKAKIAYPTLSAQQHIARERMQARTKYKAPSVRSKREKNREKYASLSESMNNLSDSGGISVADFNSLADPHESLRKSSIMSLSMTSSMASEVGLSDKYDPFISAKRQFEDLFSPNMTTSLTTKSPSSPAKNVSKLTSFRRTSSLRVPKKTSPVSYAPKYKPAIQRGISDEGPMSANFVKSEEYDELPVKSHATIPPDLVPKSPKSSNRGQTVASPLVVKRTSTSNRRHLHTEQADSSDSRLIKTDSLAAFLEFENDVNEVVEYIVSDSESIDKSNLPDCEQDAEPDMGDENYSSEWETNIKAPIESFSMKNIPLITAKPNSINKHIECNNNDDSNCYAIDLNNSNICDNLQNNHTPEAADASERIECHADADENIDLSHRHHLSRLASESSIILNTNYELIINAKNANDTDKRNPKRQIRYLKDNLLFDHVNDNDSSDSAKLTESNGGSDHCSKRIEISTRTSSKRRDNNANDKNHITQQSRDIEALFDDFDLEEFISTFNDNEQFPIFKNYKDQRTTNSRDNESTADAVVSKYNEQITTDRRQSKNSIADEYHMNHFNTECDDKQMMHHGNENNLRKPDVTAEAEQYFKIESEQLTQLKDILGNGDVMTQTERELLASVQELSNMCDDSKTLDLTSSADKCNNRYAVDTLLRSGRTVDEKPLNRSKGYNQWNRQHSILSYQVPEIINVPSINKSLHDLSPRRLATAPAYPDRKSTVNTDSKQIDGLATTPNTTTTTFDCILPPIAMHKNDSQNIYNTINMLSNNYKHFHHLESGGSSGVVGIGGGGGMSGVGEYKLSTSKLREPLNENINILSKFCYECGAKFIYDQAKFCVECGVKRVVLD